jgi:hypothetical protein
MTRSGWSPSLVIVAGFLALLVAFRVADMYGYLPEQAFEVKPSSVRP